MPDLQAVWAALPSPAFILDASDLICAANPEAEHFTNEGARTLNGTPFLDRLAIDAPIGGALSRCRENGAPIHVNGCHVTSGQSAPIACNLHLTPLETGSPMVLVVVQPRQAWERGEEGGARAGTTRSAIGMAEMLAHEIKNPLAGITGAAQLLAEDLDAEGRGLTDLIVAETRRIVTLLERVEQFGNVSIGPRKAINLHDILDRARNMAVLGFAGHMRFVVDYDPSLPMTLADGDQLMQVFLNLIKNAAEAAPEGGTITLRSYYDGALRLRDENGQGRALPLQVEIIDDGPGVPDGLRDALFEPFVSGRPNGSGLGLALVAKIISDHGGWISLNSVPGETLFRLSLPVAPQQNEEV